MRGELATPLPRRSGEAPSTRPVMPHQQMDQTAPEQLQEELWRRMSALDGVRTGRSGVSLPESRALHLDRALAEGPANAFMVGTEFAHLHGAGDGSLHAMLPETVAAEAIDRGWAELHPGPVKHPSSRWTSALAKKVASDLAARGWRLETVTTDHGSEFKGHFGPALADLGAHHRRNVAGRPQSNGCVERIHETILEECWKPAFARHLLPGLTGLREELRRYLRYYNTDRAHTGRLTQGRTPEEVIGAAKMFSR